MVLKTAQKSPAMLMPMWIVYVATVLGCGLMTVRYLGHMYDAIAHGEGGGNASLVTDEEGNVDMSKL